MAIKDLHLEARLGRKKKLLKRRPIPLLQPAPLVNRYQDGCFHPPLGHDLRPFGDALFEQLTEPGFCFSAPANSSLGLA